jgi:hypothetical protein
MATWGDAHTRLLEACAARFGIPLTDDEGRAWTRKVAEQFAFSFPAEGWGHKDAGGSRPPSSDVIATRTPFRGYDLLGGLGAVDTAGRPIPPTLITSPGAIDLAGQHFIEVTPIDHLDAGGGSGGAGTTPPLPMDLAKLTAAVVATGEAVTTLAAAMREARTSLVGLEQSLAALRVEVNDPTRTPAAAIQSLRDRVDELALHFDGALAHGAWPVKVSGRTVFGGVTLDGHVGPQKKGGTG